MQPELSEWLDLLTLDDYILYELATTHEDAEVRAWAMGKLPNPLITNKEAKP